MIVLESSEMRRNGNGTCGRGARETQPADRPVVSPYFRRKDVLDRVLAAVLLVPLLPVIGLLVLLVRLTSRGVGIYRQTRVGKDGRLFTIYKIRTMRQDAEAISGPVWATASDNRITPIGRVLRKLHLDELPQLVNVLQGDMSLVGPRPERPEITSKLVKDIPCFLDRLVVRPGVTGLAQVNLEPDTDLRSVRKKLVLDLEYVRRANLLLDLRLLLGTSLRLVGIGAGLASRWTCLRRDVTHLDAPEVPANGRALPASIRCPVGLQTPGVQPDRSITVWNRLDAGSPAGDGAPARSKSACTRKSDPVNAFTVDVEDYYHVSAFEKDIDRGDWPRYTSRVVNNTRRMLRLLDRHNVRATFFVLGWVARRNPELVAEIHRGGHEIGSHGYWHRLIYTQTPEQFRRDLRQSRDVLADIIGEPIRAYRGASFSITRKSLWALDILAEEGFSMDSSIFPICHDRYGIPGFEPKLQSHATPSGPIWEFPLSVARFGRVHVPVGGGGYFRLFPLPWTLHCLGNLNRKNRRPFVFYVHPWEIDPDQPRLKAGSLLAKFRHRIHLSTTEEKLNRLLENFRFGRLRDVIDEENDAKRCLAGEVGRAATLPEVTVRC